ncbi:hypothetical protein OPV22_007001 [Ensete ventricosum]|uniref:Uncharacterized protein n=1 Tax=Ensete ventricosum TaxID=4639 RepID=A0AAV8RU72_ENSVE|nr:hypothetical protein OPV22_007001 [Ensete ventricosum]
MSRNVVRIRFRRSSSECPKHGLNPVQFARHRRRAGERRHRCQGSYEKGCCISLRWGKNESLLRPIILILWFPADPGPKVRYASYRA